MILYIVRHGETDWNLAHRIQGRTDIELNDYGRHLAEETARGMEDIPIDIGYTSPLKRARETARIILGKRKTPLFDEPRIQEISFGSYEGLFSSGEDEKSRAFNLFFTDTKHYVPPGDGETIRQLYERTGNFLSEIISGEELKDKRILISTHGAAMTALLNRIKGNVSVEHFWKDEVPPNCSVTEVRIWNGKAEIIKEGMIFYKEKVKKWKTV
nr:histidine phosphatase family protein [uncultured Mediterraneibacter sp.]